MDHDDVMEGKAGVRKHLLARLDEAGLVKAKGVAEAAHDALRERLVDWLSYMSANNLMTLADLVIENAEGPKHNHWPAEVVIKGFAQSLQRRPISEGRIVTSWMASIEGPAAEMGGYLVELLRWLRAHGRRPLGWDAKAMMQQAADNQRSLHLIAGRIERGTATPEDLAFATGYANDLARAREIVAMGVARRSAQSAGGDGEAAA